MDRAEMEKALIDFIQIPSVTASEAEEKAVSFLADILRCHSIDYEYITKIAHRPNLLARLEPQSSEASPVILISHIDVVSGEQKHWSHPIFGGEIHQGSIYGRGALDTKHLTMMELFAFLNLAKKQELLKRPVYFLATVDEEAGSIYGMEYVKAVRPSLFKNSIVINEGGGFPLCIGGNSFMPVTVGEKASCKVRLFAKGQGGHASAPSGDQAVLHLASGAKQVLTALPNTGSRATLHEMQKSLGYKPDYALAAEFMAYADQSSVSYQNVQIGMKSNVVPSKAELLLEYRLLPGTSKDDIESFLQEKLNGTNTGFEIMSFESGFEQNINEPEVQLFMSLLREASGRWGFEVMPLPILALGRTDGRFFGTEGSHVFGCSPLLMTDSFDKILPKVHGNDECIGQKSFGFGCDVLNDVISGICLKGGSE